MVKEHKTDKQQKKRNEDEQTPKTRSDKHERKEEQVEKKEKKTFWVQIRLLPIWLRIILVLLLLVGAAALGLYVGYSVIGDGSPGEIFKKETWTHITDIINGVE